MTPVTPVLVFLRVVFFLPALVVFVVFFLVVVFLAMVPSVEAPGLFRSAVDTHR